MRTQIYLQTITWFILLDLSIVLIIILQFFCFCAVGLDALRSQGKAHISQFSTSFALGKLFASQNR